MGLKQSAFLTEFRSAFEAHIGRPVVWSGGQTLANVAGFEPDLLVRRAGVTRSSETFEIGDLRTELDTHTLVVEFESSVPSVHNLVKYWPFIRGDLSRSPSRPIVLAHFSDWWSYGSHRDLWEWMQMRMATDSESRVAFDARQFDHWGNNAAARTSELRRCFAWIEKITGPDGLAR